MKLFHGSNVAVEIPNLAFSRKSLDFGAGFYTTANKNQAAAFAEKVMIRKKQKSKAVSVYNFDTGKAEANLSILEFTAPEKLWLDFIYQNRRGIYNGKNYDLIIGPVANDDIYATLIVYEQGILNAEQTLEALKMKELYNQYVFKTEKALSFLEFDNSFYPEDEL